jgi:RHS repeat-associated protein
MYSQSQWIGSAGIFALTYYIIRNIPVIIPKTLKRATGLVATTGSSTDPYKFAATSGYRDDGDAGLSHVGARYYDAQVGRFITRDTELDQHPYLYCHHDPVNNVDPTGHALILLMGAALAVVLGPGFVDKALPGSPVPGWGLGAISDTLLENLFERAEAGTLGTVVGAIGTIGNGAGAFAEGMIQVVKYRDKIEDYMDPDGKWLL